MTTATKAPKQCAVGIIPDAAPTTFAEVLAKINASNAFFAAHDRRSRTWLAPAWIEVNAR